MRDMSVRALVAAGVLVSAATFAVHAQQLPGALGTTSGSIEILPVHGSVYMLAGPAGNSVVQVCIQNSSSSSRSSLASFLQ